MPLASLVVDWITSGFDQDAEIELKMVVLAFVQTVISHFRPD